MTNFAPMRYHGVDLQAWLAANGFHPGPIDGIVGKRTRSATADMMDARGVTQIRHIFPASGLTRVHWHWTAGAEGVIEMERRAYNGLIGKAGERIPGVFPIEAQATYRVGHAANHTRNCNSTAVGLSVDAMAGAKERPLYLGPNPMSEWQIEALVDWTADLCIQHGIPVSRYTTLSHAEVQPTLGVRQKWKWDFTWLPGDTKTRDPLEIGDELRVQVSEAMLQKTGRGRPHQSAAVAYDAAPDPLAEEEDLLEPLDEAVLMAQIAGDVRADVGVVV